MATINEALKSAVSNINNDRLGISAAVGLAMIDQCRKLLCKGYSINTELNDVLSLDENNDCQLDFTRYLR